MYADSMTGATAKSKPRVSKIDKCELSQLQRQDYRLQVLRAKLLMDLIFVCASLSLSLQHKSGLMGYSNITGECLNKSAYRV